MSHRAAPDKPTLHTIGSVEPDVAAADQVPELLSHLDAARRARSEDRVRLVADVELRRRRRQRECVSLLHELTPHLHAARTVERELDRHFARRFNVFRYLRTDELGLSQIIADLLDPAAEHGQSSAFLEAMLELLGIVPDATDSGASVREASDGGNRPSTWEGRFGRLRSTTNSKIRVVQERRTTDGRFIDVTVDIRTDDGPFCLAFENKPYANDQRAQCADYLKFLDREYRGRFLLVYLPPRYWMPDESSLPPADRERWRNHFRVLPYVAGDGASLADWFGTCCKICDAERLRWFLREAQLFCEHHFGESPMTDTEARYIREYLEENPKHLAAAFAVFRAWPAFKHDVCRRFLEHLRDRVEERVRGEFPEIADDCDVRCRYGGEKKHASYLGVYRYGWVRYEGGSDKTAGRTGVLLECGAGPTSWHWGVRNSKSKEGMTEPESERRERVELALRRRGLSLPDDGWWPHIEKPRFQNWGNIVPELAQELADGGGRVTDHYANGLLKIANRAIPVINEVELVNVSSSDSGDS